MMKNKQTLLEGLNEQQLAAVTHSGSDSLILAGAGAGKTRVLTTKIAYLLNEGIAPYEILSLTFTNKAAREMRERITVLVGQRLAAQLFMGTFHSVFARWLRRYASLLGYEPNYSIYDSSDSRSLIKLIIKELSLSEKSYKPASVQAMISSAKNDGVSADTLVVDQEMYVSLSKRGLQRFPDIFRLYEQRCRRANAMDFDDLLLNMYRILERHPEVRADFQQRFKYILVDEYQDTNRIQDLIVRMLRGPRTEVTVVGDDAQSIYSFRGAVIDNILRFDRHFPGARLFKLTKNYRSTVSIVEAANSLIAKNVHRIPKEIEAVSGVGERLLVFKSFSGREEAQKVAAMIKKQENDDVSLDDIAILYRTNAQSRLFEESLRDFGIKYRIYGGLSFFDRKEIKDVMSYMRLIVNARDDEAFRRIVNFPARGIGEASLSALMTAAQEQECSLLEVAMSVEMMSSYLKGRAVQKLHAFAELIEALRLETVQSPQLHEAVLMIVKKSGLLDEYRDGSVESQARLDNLDELVSAANEYDLNRQGETGEAATLEDFVRDMALYTDSDQQEDDAPRVTLMTMHASKGLEYGYVYCVGIEDGMIPSDRSSLLSDIEEERRLLYVAITRAKKQCVLSFASSRMVRGANMICVPSRFLRELDPQYIHDVSGTICSDTVSPGNTVDIGVNRHQQRVGHTHTPTQNESRGTGRKLRVIGRSSVGSEGLETRHPDGEMRDSDPSVMFAKGDRIAHAQFGEGIVQGFMDSLSGTKVVVAFDEGMTRQLILKYAKLTMAE